DVINLVQWLDSCDFLTACETLTGRQPPPRKGNGRARAGLQQIVVAHFSYEDGKGAVLSGVQRVGYPPGDRGPAFETGQGKKTFRQKRPDPAKPGRWIYNIDGVRVVPYRLPELLEAIAQSRAVFIVEGERKADALAAWNIPATCNAMGAGHWTAEHSTFLKN